MGHLELNGFEAHRGYIMDHGDSTAPYRKFEKYSQVTIIARAPEVTYLILVILIRFIGMIIETDVGFIFLIPRH